MGCDPVTFGSTVVPITRADLACLKDALVKSGVSVPDGDSGEISGHGITAQVEYVEPMLTVTITNKHWYQPCSAIISAILDHIKTCQANEPPIVPAPIPEPAPQPQPPPVATPPIPPVVVPPEPPKPTPPLPIGGEFARGIQTERERCDGIVQRTLMATTADPDKAVLHLLEALKEIQQ